MTTTNTQHTKGPWEAIKKEGYYVISPVIGGASIAHTSNGNILQVDETKANAQLIASAPELLKENEQLKRDIEERDREQGRQLKLNAELLEALNALMQHSPNVDPEMKEIPESMFSFTVTYRDYWKAAITKAKAEGKEQTKN